MLNRRAFAKRLASSVIGLAGLAYAAACAYLWTHQRALIYLPDAAVLRTPRDLGIEFREIAIPVAERSIINAWWLPADSGGSGGVTVLYLHGNDGNLGSEVERVTGHPIIPSLGKRNFPTLNLWRVVDVR